MKRLSSRVLRVMRARVYLQRRVRRRQLFLPYGNLTRAECRALATSIQRARKVRPTATARDRIILWQDSVTTRTDYDYQREASRAANGVRWLEAFRVWQQDKRYTA